MNENAANFASKKPKNGAFDAMNPTDHLENPNHNPKNTADNPKNHFDRQNPRARAARLSKIFSTLVMRVLIVLASVVSLIFGFLLLFLKNPAGWLLLALAFILLIWLIYVENYLKIVPIGKTDSFTDLLSLDCLYILNDSENLAKIASNLVKNTRSGRFLAARFGITEKFMLFVAESLGDKAQNSENPPQSFPESAYLSQNSAIFAQIFSLAREIREEENCHTISGACLELAMIFSLENCDDLLRARKLEKADLLQGLTWYNYLHGLVKNAKVYRKTGGIGRDLSFGYIPLLSRLAENISASGALSSEQVRLASHREIVDQIIDIFSSSGRQNVALVGSDGVGKDTIVRSFAWEILADDAKIPQSLRFRQVFRLDAASLIASASAPGELERLMNAILNEAYNAKNIILYLKDAHLFFEQGTGSVDISNVLTPILENGAIRLILTLDEQKYLEISAKNPALANALNRISVEPASEGETLRVMEDAVPVLEYKYKVIYTIWSLKEAYRLAKRYVYDLAMPGRALRLLESAAHYPENHFVNENSVAAAVEKTEGVKVQVEKNADEREKLLNLEHLIHERMIDQAPAVKTVSDALRRSAAGVRNPSRPIGTFLFLGPTGVGKTELSKAIATVYFGENSELVRVDLNEYVSENDVSRLVAEAAENPDSLAAKVRKNPFSVVLLDEIEKAHPKVLTTLLQVLDEGILRDSKNREISFRDTIIIATSNAGSTEIRAAVKSGLFNAYSGPQTTADSLAQSSTSVGPESALAKFKSTLTEKLISSGEFKPEFLNRFDEICLFKPLEKEDLRQIAALLLKSVNQTLAPQKITVSLTDDAYDYLISVGYDPELGARPLRRVVQNTVENTVSRLILSGNLQPGQSVTLSARDLAAAHNS